MKQLDVIQPLAGTDKLVETWCKKMAPPLVTLLSAEPEVQYVALRNINLVVQKRPRILANEVKVRRWRGTGQWPLALQRIMAYSCASKQWGAKASCRPSLLLRLCSAERPLTTCTAP